MASTKQHDATGLLWLDGDGVGVENTLPEAVAAFRRMFGRRPELILLPAEAIDKEYGLDGLRVEPAESCPPRHALLF